ncbi:hypothetical protein V6N13_021415 [Hibiscus sabdariffa]|uniref:Uncharacterized protein n=1 Tax=Hibiscus sabdariffa TaxID=183260 RepID=A0ABR2A8K7_9ROSI
MDKLRVVRRTSLSVKQTSSCMWLKLEAKVSEHCGEGERERERGQLQRSKRFGNWQQLAQEMLIWVDVKEEEEEETKLERNGDG